MAYSLRMRILFGAVMIASILPTYIVFDGQLTGALLAYFMHARIPEGSQDYLYEVKRRQWFNYISIPGLPMENMATNPYWIPKLYSWNWYTHLNLTRCTMGEPDCTNGMWNPVNEPIDKLARFEEFRRKRSSQDPLHHWIYVSKWALLNEFDPWNRAFINLLQHHNCISPAHNATLHLLDCMESKFLCHIWAVRGPSMIHITFKEPSKELLEAGDRVFVSPDLHLEVRVIELPLKEKLKGTLQTFPSQFEQLRRLTSNKNIYLEFDEYDEQKQLERAFEDWLDEKKGGGLFGHLQVSMSRPTDWLLERSGALQPLWNVAVFLSYSIVLLVLAICSFVWGLLRAGFSWFLASPQWLAAQPSGNFLSDLMMGSFMDFLDKVKNNLTEEMLSKTSSFVSEVSSIVDEALGYSTASSAPTG
jgi:hypothetical protein